MKYTWEESDIWIGRQIDTDEYGRLTIAVTDHHLDELYCLIDKNWFIQITACSRKDLFLLLNNRKYKPVNS